MAAIPEPDPHRRQLIQALQTPGRGWQFGPSGSAQQLPTGFATPPPVPQLIPFSPQKPALVGGIPLGAPKIKTGSEDVHVGGVVIHPEGTIQQEPSAPLTQLAPLATLAPVDLQKPTSLGAGPALSDISKLSIPTIVPIEPLVSGLAPSLVKPPGAPPLGMIPALPSLTTLPSVATFVPPPALGEIMEREGREGGE